MAVMDYQPNNNKFIFLLAVVIIGLLSFLIPYDTTLLLGMEEDTVLAQYREIDIISNHAYANHGLEVNKALKCLQDMGSMMTYRTFGFTEKDGTPINTSVYICFDPATKVYYAVILTFWRTIRGNQVARLVTAYKIIGDIFSTLDEYIEYIGKKWAAELINYKIDPGKILINITW